MRGERKSIEVAKIEHLLDSVVRESREARTELRAEIIKLRKTLDEHTERYNNLQTSIVKTLTFMFQLLDDPDAKEHAKAVATDYFFSQRHNSKNEQHD